MSADRRSWIRILLAVLGGSEMLMAAGAAPTALIVGLAGGACIVGAAWLGTERGSGSFIGLVALGTVPFAVVAWTALVPVLLALVAAALGTSVVQATRRAGAVDPTMRRLTPRESSGDAQ